jgi:hypothetical protein
VTLLETDTMETRRIEIDPEMSLYPPKGARPATDQKFAAPLPETKNL